MDELFALEPDLSAIVEVAVTRAASQFSGLQNSSCAAGMAASANGAIVRYL